MSMLDNELNDPTINNSGYIYIATTKQYAKCNIFEVGECKTLDEKLQYSNLNNIDDNQFYYVYVHESLCIEIVETAISNLLNLYRGRVKDDFKLYTLPFHLLQPMVENICKTFNEKIIPMVNDAEKSNVEYTANKISTPPENIFSDLYINSDYDSNEYDSDF
jgi:hypothetical protein